MAYIPNHRAVIQPQGSYTTTSKFVHKYSIMTSWFCTCTVTESLKRMKAMKRVNTQKKLYLSLKKRKKEPIDGRFSQELFV